MKHSKPKKWFGVGNQTMNSIDGRKEPVDKKYADINKCPPNKKPHCTICPIFLRSCKLGDIFLAQMKLPNDKTIENHIDEH